MNKEGEKKTGRDESNEVRPEGQGPNKPVDVEGILEQLRETESHLDGRIKGRPKGRGGGPSHQRKRRD